MNKEEKQKNNIENEILNKISEEHIKPKPRWEFLLTNGMFWSFGLITVILGAFTISASIYFVENIRWEFYEATHENLFTFMIEFMPYLWIILFVLFLVFTYHFIKKTRHGYKHDIKLVAGSTLLISVLLGIVFANLGFGALIDDSIGSKIPFHRGIKMHSYMIWDKPEEGLLVGKIQSIDDEFVLSNFKNEIKNLIIDDLDKMSLDLLESNEVVRVIGIEKEEGFYVCVILPDFGPGNSPQKPRNFFFERKDISERNIECEGIKPYDRLLNNY